MSPGCVYTYSYWRLVAIGVSLHQWSLWGVNGAYIHIGVGLALLVSITMGTWKGLRTWSERQCRASRFFYVLIVNLITNTDGRRSPRPHNGNYFPAKILTRTYVDTSSKL